MLTTLAIMAIIAYGLIQAFRGAALIHADTTRDGRGLPYKDR